MGIFGETLFQTQLLYNAVIGGSIIFIFNILPNGRAFFLNLYKMGRECILFDANRREIYLVSSKLGGCRYHKKLICSYSQFRGIAVHYKSKQILFLCKRTESLLLKQIGDMKQNQIENVLEEIGLFWFTNNNDENDCFFGITYVDFKDGIIAEGNVQINTDYDYYLKPKFSVDDDQAVYLKKDQQNIQRFQSVQGGSIDVESDNEENTQMIVDYV